MKRFETLSAVSYSDVTKAGSFGSAVGSVMTELSEDAKGLGRDMVRMLRASYDMLRSVGGDTRVAATEEICRLLEEHIGQADV